MPLTKRFGDTLKERIASDPAFVQALLEEKLVELVQAEAEIARLKAFAYGKHAAGYRMGLEEAARVVLTAELAWPRTVEGIKEALAAEIAHHIPTSEPSPPGSAHPDAAEVARLREDCAELYQVIGNLADRAGVFDHPLVTKALDNASAAAAGEPRPHDTLLPFALITPKPAV